MKEMAQFDGLTLRTTGGEDRLLLESWIAEDPVHAGRIEPEYFMGSEGCFALEDAYGVVFFIRLAKVARVRIQFNTAGGGGHRQRARVAQAMARGMALLEVGLSKAGTEEWVFDSENPDLRKFAKEVLGFRESKTDLVREIAALEREQEVA